MPNLYSSKCNNCDFKTSISSGAVMYVLDENKKKVVCPHPIEYHRIAEVLNISKDDSFSWFQGNFDKISPETKNKIEKNVGVDFQHVCMECCQETYLDTKKEKLVCSKCGSENLKYVAELTKQACPKCKTGTIELIHMGMS